MSTTYIQLTEEQLDKLTILAAYRAIDKYMGFQSKSKWLTTRDVAKKLNVSWKTITNHMNNGKMQGAFKLGAEWRITEYDLNTYLESEKQTNRKHDS